MAKRFFLTMLIALTFGATAAAADVSVDLALNGIWISEWDEEVELRFNDGDWEMWIDGGPLIGGAYKALGGAISMRVEHLHGSRLNDVDFDPYHELRWHWDFPIPFPANFDSRWYSRSDIRQAVLSATVQLVACSEDASDTLFRWADYQWGGALDATLDRMFGALEGEGIYSVSGDTLTLELDSWSDELTRR